MRIKKKLNKQMMKNFKLIFSFQKIIMNLRKKTKNKNNNKLVYCNKTASVAVVMK